MAKYMSKSAPSSSGLLVGGAGVSKSGLDARFRRRCRANARFGWVGVVWASGPAGRISEGGGGGDVGALGFEQLLKSREGFKACTLGRGDISWSTNCCFAASDVLRRLVGDSSLVEERADEDATCLRGSRCKKGAGDRILVGERPLGRYKSVMGEEKEFDDGFEWSKCWKGDRSIAEGTTGDTAEEDGVGRSRIDCLAAIDARERRRFNCNAILSKSSFRKGVFGLGTDVLVVAKAEQ